MVALLFHRLQDVLDSYDSSAKDDSCLPSCQQFAVSTCWRHALAFIRFVWLLYWFYVLKLQHCRSSVPQVRRRARQDALSANTDSISTWSVGRATRLHSEQLYGKINFISYQFREIGGPGRDASSAQLYRYVFVCGVRLVSVRRASVPQGAWLCR